MFEELVYESRNKKIRFCYDKTMCIMIINTQKLPWWKRLIGRQEYMLWQEDLDQLREILKN